MLVTWGLLRALWTRGNIAARVIRVVVMAGALAVVTTGTGNAGMELTMPCLVAVSVYTSTRSDEDSHNLSVVGGVDRRDQAS